MDFVTLNVETSSESENSVCRISAIEYENNKITYRKEWIVQPPKNEYAENYRFYTTLSPTDTENKPSIYDIWEEIENTLYNKMVIAYIANHTFSCLISSFNYFRNIWMNNNLCKGKSKKNALNCEFICLWQVLNRLFIKLRTNSLDELCNFFTDSQKNNLGINNDLKIEFIFSKVLKYFNINNFIPLKHLAGITIGQVHTYKISKNLVIKTLLKQIQEEVSIYCDESVSLSLDKIINILEQNKNTPKIYKDYFQEYYPCLPITETEEFRKYDFTDLIKKVQNENLEITTFQNENQKNFEVDSLQNENSKNLDIIEFQDETDKLNKFLKWKLITAHQFKEIVAKKQKLKTFKYKGIYTKGKFVNCDIIGYSVTNNYETLIIKISNKEIHINIDYFVEMQDNNFRLNDMEDTNHMSEVLNKRPFKGKNLHTIPVDYTIVDIETTGFSPQFDEIIEIGAIKVKNNFVIEKFSSLVKPKKAISEFITLLSGITNDMLEDAPFPKVVLKDFLDFIGDDILVGYNVNFDINFLYDYCQIYLEKNFSNDFVDLLQYAKNLLPELENHKLTTIAQHFNINTLGSHRALKDCEITKECYEYIKNKIPSDTSIEKIFNSHKKYEKANANDIIASTDSFDENNPFYKKYCCFSGALTMSRKEAMQLVADVGGICQNGVTKTTNYLILGDLDYCNAIKDGKSSKQKKAENLKLKGQDIEILSESVFHEMLKNEYN